MCPSFEELERLASGECDAEARQTADRHLSHCGSCREALGAIRANLALADRLRELTVGQVPAHESPRSEVTEQITRSAAPPSAESASLPSDTIPGYEILRTISRGGQGIVYLAIQKSTSRRVAIKVLREGHFADANDRARFEREVLILGQLKHSNIVSIYDSGSVGSNVFFVMDYISGSPLDAYAAEHFGIEGGAARSGVSRNASVVRPILRLFAKVCDGVHAAHLKGIIHRDLKPSNIRIDGGGEPHILDFGLAKLAGAAEAPAAAMTVTGMFLGSLPWSSPEQAEGQPSKIDIRTDVYALGVMLHQLLTGQFPYDVSGNIRDVLDRILRAEPKALRDRAAGFDDEVATIVRKCLYKDRERRYQSAGELARDIRHYLAGEPIEAKRDSGMYVLGKALRRYRAAAAVVALFVITLAGSAAALAVLWKLADRERSNAVEARSDAVRQAQAAEIARAEAESQRQIAEKNAAEAIALERKTYRLYEQADERREEFGQVADCLTELLRNQGDFAESAPRFAEAVAWAKDNRGPDHRHTATVLYNLASLQRVIGELADAEQNYRRSLAIRERLDGRESQTTTAQTCSALAWLLYERGNYSQARFYFQRALELIGARPRSFERWLSIRSKLSRTLVKLREFPAAESEILAVHREWSALERPPHSLTAQVYAALHELYADWPGHESEAEHWQSQWQKWRTTTQPSAPIEP